MKKRLIIGFVAALLLAVNSVHASEKLTLMLDWFPNIDHLPIYVARELGYFEKQGIDIEILSPSETADALKLSVSGHVDLAVSYQPQTIIAASQGLDVRVVGRLVEHPLTTLLFLKGKGIGTPADLKGKKIGYTVPGLMDVLLDAFMQINGIKEYTPVNVGFTIVPSLVSNQVDAVMGPFKTYETVTMAQEGIQAGFFEIEKWGIPDYEELIFVCGAKTLELKRDSIKHFSDAVQQAILYTRQDPEAALRLYLKSVPEADSKIETEAFKLTLPYYAGPGKSDIKAWQVFSDFSLQFGLIQRSVDAAVLLQE